MVVKGNNPNGIQWLISELGTQFLIKDLSFLHHFLGLEVHKSGDDLFISQQHYALELLNRAHMSECKPISTPMHAKRCHLTQLESLYFDPTLYRSLVGGLLYLTFTRLDLSYSVNFVCQFMHAPTISHYKLVKRILRYVKATTQLGLHIIASSTLDLYGFSYAD